MSSSRKSTTSRIGPFYQDSLSPNMMELDTCSLAEVRYSEQRQKVGLSPRISQLNRMHGMSNYDHKKEQLTRFVKQHFKRRECIRFVPKKGKGWKEGDPVKCHCGEEPDGHIKGVIWESEYKQGGDYYLGQSDPGTKWSVDKDIKEFTTNAYGKIEFVNEGLGGRKPSKFVRLADNTPIDSVIELMLHYWHMATPHEAHLVITVIGGAKNFKLDGKRKETFNRGLINAAQTTSAWIITSGCNMGVMKAVGEAVQEGQSFNWDQAGMTHSLRCVGIAPWGYVEKRDVLESSATANGSWNASYKVNNVIRHGLPVSLNANHTHFLLVDDGMRGRYGGVAEFRAKLERKISAPKDPEPGQESGLGIPVVLVVVEGGTDAINDVKKSLSQQIPVVLCEGTGRAADILGYAHTHMTTKGDGKRFMKPKHQNILKEKLMMAYGKTWHKMGKNETEEVENFAKMVEECCVDEKLITVFDMNKHEDLDLAILSALLKGQGATNKEQLLDQLMLALTWNRSDVAEEKIFTAEEIVWDTATLADAMMKALIENKVNFVKLLLQNGIVMTEFLTHSRLRQLYNAAPKVCPFREFMLTVTANENYSLKQIGKFIHKLLGKHDDTTYRLGEGQQLSHERQKELERITKVKKPWKELFLWAVLMNRYDMAKFMWERGDEAIPSALAASKIYGALADMVAHYDHDLQDELIRMKSEFEKLAVKIVDECQSIDPEKASMLIDLKYSTWGSLNCLEMAAGAHDREFLSTVCCQNAINSMWKGSVTSHWFMVMLALFFPPLILFGIRFQDLGEKLKFWQKFQVFFGSPCTKFAANVGVYIVFLGLYSYVILVDFGVKIQITEWIVLGWIFTLLLEEIREMLESKAETVKGKLLDWWDFSVFNRIDLLVLLLALLGFCLRVSPAYFMHAKTVYALNCVAFFIRVLRFYSASSYLGPKLVMISRMCWELLLFLMILAVFLLAYGISSQSVMHPTRRPNPLIMRDILYYPYWQIYGELYLEEMEARTDDCKGNVTIREDGTACPQFSWLVPVLTAFYLLIGNVLLINLLIAIFTHVFEEIETNSIQIWKYGMYFLSVEYYNKPTLTPPFIIFEHVFLMFRWMIRKCCCRKPVPDQQGSWSTQLRVLHVFEKEACKYFHRRQKFEWKEQETLDDRIRFIQLRVDEMGKLLEEKLQEQSHNETEQFRLMSAGSVEQPFIGPHRRLSFKHQVSNDSLMITPDSTIDPAQRRKKYWRWPSLERLKELRQQQLQGIEEHNPLMDTDNNTDIASSCGRQTPLDGNDMTDLNMALYNFKHTSDTYDKQKSTAWTHREPSQPAKLYLDSGSTNQAWVSQGQSQGHEDDRDQRGVFSSKYKQYKKKNGKKMHKSNSDEFQLLAYQESDTTDVPPSGRVSSRDSSALGFQGPCGDSDDELKQLNIPNKEAQEARLSAMEERLARLEETTSMSLYNIEALLRNAIFQKGVTSSHNPKPVVHHRKYRNKDLDPYA